MPDYDRKAAKVGIGRGREVLAALAWCVRSWVRPAGASLDWEQRAGREQDTGWAQESSHTAISGQRTPKSGTGNEPNRDQNIKVESTGT